MPHTFDKYRLRPATAADAAQIAAWVAADPAHGSMTPEFFWDKQPGVECLVLEDEEGMVFPFRISRALRIHIQFPPIACHEQRRRVMAGMMATMGFMERQAPRAGFCQLIFDSLNDKLVAFCERRLGFRKSPNELVRSVAPATTQQAQE